MCLSSHSRAALVNGMSVCTQRQALIASRLTTGLMRLGRQSTCKLMDVFKAILHHVIWYQVVRTWSMKPAAFAKP